MVRQFIIVLLMCSMSTPLALAGTFRDDFEDGNIIAWDAFGEWSVVNGELVGENMKPASDSGQVFFGELGWRNYTVEADVKLIASAGYPPATGICVRAQQELGHFHSFGFNSGSCGHTFEPGSVVGFIKLRSFSVGAWYHLKVIAEGDHFTFYINDELIGELSHQSYATGRVGLYVYNMKAHFDNVVIVGEDIPEGDFGTTPVEERGKLATTWAEIKSN